MTLTDILQTTGAGAILVLLVIGLFLLKKHLKRMTLKVTDPRR